MHRSLGGGIVCRISIVRFDGEGDDRRSALSEGGRWAEGAMGNFFLCIPFSLLSQGLMDMFGGVAMGDVRGGEPAGVSDGVWVVLGFGVCLPPRRNKYMYVCISRGLFFLYFPRLDAGCFNHMGLGKAMYSGEVTIKVLYIHKPR